MEIVINLDKEDWRKYIALLQKKLNKTISPWRGKFWLRASFWLELIFGIVIGFGFMLAIFNSIDIHWPTAKLAIAFFVVMGGVFLLRYRMLQKELVKACEPSEEGVYVGEHKVLFDDKGIQWQGKGYRRSLTWPVVKKVERDQGMILVYEDTIEALVFPESKLSNPDEFYKFIMGKYLMAKPASK